METEFFDIVNGVLQGDTLASFLLIICLGYVLRTSIDLIKEHGFTLKKAKSRRHLAETTQAEPLLHSLEQIAGSIGLSVNADKTKYMSFNQEGDISTLNGSSLKLVYKFIYPGSSFSCTGSDVNTNLEKVWTLIKHIEKRLDGNCTRMLRAILNKSWKQHPTKQQLYCHLPPISKTIQIRWTRHAGHC